jgi:acyl-coenzyme A synthetase/AMP-(fatty) acid ligase
VVGVPDDLLGEEVGAAIALAPGAEADAAEIRDFVKERVAGYKYPRRIWFVDELPKGPPGKDPQTRYRSARAGVMSYVRSFGVQGVWDRFSRRGVTK